MSELLAAQLDDIFSALAHQKRRDILNGLAYRPYTISQLASEFKLSLPLINKHLRSLETADLIKRRKAGRTNFIALNKQTLGKAQDWMLQYYTAWGNDQETLDNYIASMEQS